MVWTLPTGNGLVELVQTINPQIPIFGSFVLILVFLFFFLRLKGAYKLSAAWVAASFITMIVSLIFAAVNITGEFMVLLSTISLVIGAIALVFDSE